MRCPVITGRDRGGGDNAALADGCGCLTAEGGLFDFEKRSGCERGRGPEVCAVADPWMPPVCKKIQCVTVATQLDPPLSDTILARRSAV